MMMMPLDDCWHTERTHMAIDNWLMRMVVSNDNNNNNNTDNSAFGVGGCCCSCEKITTYSMSAIIIAIVMSASLAFNLHRPLIDNLKELFSRYVHFY